MRALTTAIFIVAGLLGLFYVAVTVSDFDDRQNFRTKQSNVQKPIILADEETKGSPEFREYVATMLRFQYSLETAFHAGICGLRSEAYFNTFKVAQFQLSVLLAKRFNLSSSEMSRADWEVNRQFAQVHQGAPDFDLTKGCAFLRTSPQMDELDELHRSLTGNYH